MKRFVVFDLKNSFLKENNLQNFGDKMKKKSIKDLKMDLKDSEGMEIVIIPQKKLLKWFDNLENERKLVRTQ